MSRSIARGTSRSRASLSRLMAVALALAFAVAGLSTPAAADAPWPVRSADDAHSWGANGYGQLGDGTAAHRNVPGEVNLPEGVRLTQVSAGYGHTVALTSDGRVLAWGGSVYGQVGDGTNVNRTTPVEVPMPDGVRISRVAAGGYHSLAVTRNGRVFAWGGNGYGQLGDGTTTHRNAPVRVPMPDGARITQITGGEYHSVAVTRNGRVLAWGANNAGQLGDATTTHRTTPVWVRLPAGTRVDQVAAGLHHSVAVTRNDRALAWGANGAGQLGDGTNSTHTTPAWVDLPAGTRVDQVAARTHHSLAVTRNDRVLAWGLNQAGQLGDGSTTSRNTPVRVDLGAGVRVDQVAAGTYSSHAVTLDGHVLTWGINAYGQLGEGTNGTHTTPVRAKLPGQKAATQVTAGYAHTVALTEWRER